ncbi:DUF4190 domain-containing protein [Knoellia sp. CPCC 206453]|uniref:DUF4190 domain-containing protein n=1 Tax=Knoellia pratensis TaxID=3404796 RepID=UPI00360A42FE
MSDTPSIPSGPDNSGSTPPPPPPTGGGYNAPPPPPAGGGYNAPPPPSGGDYGAPPPAGGYGGQPVNPQNKKALWSMILGIASIPLVFCCYFGVPLAIAGIVLSVISKGEIERSGGVQTNGGNAKVGLITSIVALALVVLLIILAVSGVLDPSEWARQMEGQSGS